MKKFTKSLIALALLFAGTMGVNAEKKYADLTKLATVQGTNATWNGETNTISWTAASNNLISNFDFGFEHPVDLSGWVTINVTISSVGDGTSGIRLQMKADGQESNPFELTEGAKTYTYNLSDFTIRWSPNPCDITKVDFLRILGLGEAGSAVISEVYLERPDDPNALLKDNLSATITKGKAQNSFAKTEESFGILEAAIEAGETELKNTSATEESLTEAKKAIEDAIAGLKLMDGYVNFTKSMFHEWSGIGEDATITGTGNCDLVLNSQIANGGMLYGSSSVLWNQYAKLVNAKSLVILGAPSGVTFGVRTDRLAVGDGGGDDNGGSLTQIDVTIDNQGKGIIDLSGNASIRINAIKKAWSGDPATVTDLLVEYKPLAVTVGAAGYSTFSADLNTKVKGAKAYAAKLSGDKVELTEVTEIPAGVGVIVEAAAADYEFPVVNEAAAIADNDLLVSDGSVTGNGSTIYVLAKKGEKVGFYLLKNGENVPAGKAYLNVSVSGREFIGFAEDVTAIKSVETVKANGAIYNLAGQQVKKAQKGLYIINGKKVIK